MGYKRKALLQVAGSVLDSVSRAQRDNISGQMDLFGGFEQEEAPQSLVLPEVEEYSLRERMDMEKETTGLYLSGHPMDEYRDAVRRIGAPSIGAILSDFAAEDGPRRFADGQNVVLAGLVDSVRTRTTKNNTLMSYIRLEDDTGSMELIAFQKALDNGGSYVKDNAALIVKGRLDVRDEKEPQLVVESFRPLSDLNQIGTQAPPPREQKLWVKLPSRYDPALKHIEKLLTMFPGNQQMIVWCEREKKRVTAPCLIHQGLILELQEMLGKENVVVK